MIETRSFRGKVKSLWLSARAIWMLLAFASLALVRFLPAGYLRAAVAVPILLMVPGSLTLGAIFSERSRPRGAAFVCYALLLGLIWSFFASLALYVLGLRITLDSTFLSLLIVSMLLAIAAQIQILLGRPAKGRRAAPRPDISDPDFFGADADDDAGTPTTVRGTNHYAILTVVAGVSLLSGGVLVYEHLPQPAPAGYTWIAWTGSSVTGPISIGSAGSQLRFQIVHHQTDTTTFRLSAFWLGSPSQPLARPINLKIGPDQAFHGTLSVPSPPDGCTYRIVVALTADQQINPLTKKPQTWSINADVRNPGKSQKTCRR